MCFFFYYYYYAELKTAKQLRRKEKKCSSRSKLELSENKWIRGVVRRMIVCLFFLRSKCKVQTFSLSLLVYVLFILLPFFNIHFWEAFCYYLLERGFGWWIWSCGQFTIWPWAIFFLWPFNFCFHLIWPLVCTFLLENWIVTTAIEYGLI